MKGSRRSIVWSPEAEQDLLEIWRYIARASGASTADEVLCQIDARSLSLGAWPEYGKARDDVRKGLRSVSEEAVFAFVDCFGDC